jgi:nitrate/nitrite transport system substrate-binding protein
VDALLPRRRRHHPDKDVNLITIPPPQMVANMKIGKMDGFCVGEPWNARAIADKIGFTSVTTQDMWKDHPEKVCAFTEEFADPQSQDRQSRAQGAARSQRLARRPLQSSRTMRDRLEANYINCPTRRFLLGRLLGKLDYGDGRT